ncbi:hypothetical protein ABVN80_03675 [Acinetobacter baumannii]
MLQHNEELRAKLKEAFEAKISEAYTIAVKQDRYAALDALHAGSCCFQFVPEEDVDGIADEVDYLFEDLKYRTVRDNILSGKPRIDGRDTKTVRALDVQVGVLLSVHMVLHYLHVVKLRRW